MSAMPAPSTNPIIPGFAPDPSVVLIDNTFILVNSSFHVFPGLPIYASEDLVTWKHIGEHRQPTIHVFLSVLIKV